LSWQDLPRRQRDSFRIGDLEVDIVASWGAASTAPTDDHEGGGDDEENGRGILRPYQTDEGSAASVAA
jgi:hypothetical protein